MCGVAGWARNDPQREAPREALRKMTDAMIHRGPDASGFYLDKGIGLGHRRLSIIDRDGGRQPMTGRDGNATIVFNGEIYNYRALRAELESRGREFATRSDTEVILQSYEEYGLGCLASLRGMFAFAIWDRSERRLLLARDRLGIKPLYYTRTPGGLLFASEIKALLEAPAAAREVNEPALDSYLSLRYVPGPETLFKNIFKLRPGHFLLFKEGEMKERGYWDLEFREEKAWDEDPIDAFRALLKESVGSHLMSEVPLGVFLSGGLDSSAIVAEMVAWSQENGSAHAEKIKTFSIGYEDSESNELDDAREAARRLGTDHHEFRLEGRDFRNFIPKMVWYLDEPIADPSCVPLFFISKRAQRAVTVILSGEGADEILAGYGLYHKMRMIDRIQKRSPEGALRLLSRLLSASRSARWRKYAEWIDRPLEARYRGVSRVFTDAAKEALLLKRDDGALSLLFNEYYRKSAGLDPINRMLYVDTKVWLPDQILTKADKMTMANSQELRVPFLDHKLVEFAATLPVRLKYAKGVGKVLLRRAMSERLPPAILKRPKKGFPIPAAWFRKEVIPAANELLFDPDSLVARFMRREKVAELLREEEGRPYSHHKEIWTLLVLEYWHRVFILRKGGIS